MCGTQLNSSLERFKSSTCTQITVFRNTMAAELCGCWLVCVCPTHSSMFWMDWYQIWLRWYIWDVSGNILVPAADFSCQKKFSCQTCCDSADCRWMNTTINWVSLCGKMYLTQLGLASWEACAETKLVQAQRDFIRHDLTSNIQVNLFSWWMTWSRECCVSADCLEISCCQYSC